MKKQPKVLHGSSFFDKNLPIFLAKYPAVHPDQRHTHDFLEFYFIVEGVGKHIIGKKSYPVEKGDVVVLNYRQDHSFGPLEKNLNLEVITCAFLPSFIQPQLKDLEQIEGFVDFFYLEPFFREETASGPKLHLIGEDEFEIRLRLERMVKEYRGKKTGYELALKSLLTETLIQLARLYRSYEDKFKLSKGMDTRKSLILEAVKYVDQHLHEEIRLDEVASVCYVTSNHFCGLFKKVTGKPLFQYVNEQRIRKACQELKTSDKKILTIASETGFRSLHYFSRIFRKVTGTTPGQWREKQRI